MGSSLDDVTGLLPVTSQAEPRVLRLKGMLMIRGFFKAGIGLGPGARVEGAGGSMEALRRKVLERKGLTRFGIRLIRLVSVWRSWFGDRVPVVPRLALVPRILTWKGTPTFLVLAFRWGLGSWARV